MIDYSDLIGVPFKNRGRDKNTGLDCYGLVMEVYKKIGIQLPEYYADWNNVEKINGIIQQEVGTSLWRKVEGSHIPIPCVTAIRFGVPKGVVNHTGVYVGNGKFIHIRENVGVCVDRVNSPAWKKQIEGFYEYIG